MSEIPAAALRCHTVICVLGWPLSAPAAALAGSLEQSAAPGDE